jgi:hypothetical protein
MHHAAPYLYSRLVKPLIDYIPRPAVTRCQAIDRRGPLGGKWSPILRHRMDVEATTAFQIV